MIKSKEEVFELLKQLGTIKSDVFTKLSSLGIKGEMRSCSRCPIAKYILSCDAGSATSVAGGYDSLLVTLVDHPTGEATHYEYLYRSHPCVTAVADFIKAFDSAEYPGLEFRG